MTYSSTLSLAIEAAKVGAAKANSYYKTDLSIELKKDQSVVTIADRETEKHIKSFISSHDKNAQFVGEETGGDTSASEFWIIDPIDGTRSYSRGIDSWSVLLAFCKNQEIVVGVAYFPIWNYLLVAEKGHGAFLNDKKVSVSTVSQFKNAYVGFGSPGHFKNQKMLGEYIQTCAAARCPEATYATMLVASGGFEAMMDSYAQLWDVAPFRVIIPEAGGRITNFDGQQLSFNDRGFIASNGLVHDEILSIVNKNK
jgi:fructose-1,6-bisphosphatase/inositol monophosphatase family enzyme